MSDTLAVESHTNPPEGDGEGGQRRLLLMVGGAAVVLVLGLAAYFLFLSGGEEEELAPVPSAAGTATEPPKKDKGQKSDDRVPDEVDTDFQVGRDPFAPLAVEEVVIEPASTEEEGAEPDSDADANTRGGSNTTPAPTPSPTEDPEPEVISYKVTLKSVDVAKDSAVIDVDGKRYTVKVGDFFTNSDTGPFKLTGVDTRSGKGTATVVFGSDAPVEIIQNDSEVFKTA